MQMLLISSEMENKKQILVSIEEKKEIIAKSLGFVQDKYYTASEIMNKNNLICSIMKI